MQHGRHNDASLATRNIDYAWIHCIGVLTCLLPSHTYPRGTFNVEIVCAFYVEVFSCVGFYMCMNLYTTNLCGSGGALVQSV